MKAASTEKKVSDCDSVIDGGTTMTDEELKALVASNSQAIREMRETSEKREKRFEAAQRESKERFAAFEKSLAESKKESERIWQEVLFSRQETDRPIRKLDRRLGDLGDYTEAMSVPSLERILREQFRMTVFKAPEHITVGNETLEIDLVAHARDEIDEVYLVEIKSKLHQDAIDQLHEHLRRFPRLFPEHRGKKLFGILVAVQVPDALRAKVRKEGFYLATVKDSVFEITPPDGFEPRTFGLRAQG
jgi:hypothetical protein